MRLSASHPYRSAEARDKYLSFYDQTGEQWPVQSENRMVPTSYGETFVRISGPADGQPLVLLPGMASTSLFWAPNIEAFSAQYRTCALDNIADVGRSICTKAIAHVRDFVQWLDELFTALGIGDQMNLLGVSYGGWLTAQYGLSFPNRLRRIVMLAPAATVLRTSIELYVRAMPMLTGNRNLTRKTVYWLLQDLARKDPARVELSLDRLLLTLQCAKARRLITPTILKDHELESLRTPALFLVGEREKIYSAAKAVERLRRVAPQITTEIIPGAGHDLTIARPEEVNRIVLEFLQ